MPDSSGCKWLQTVANAMKKEMQIRPCSEAQSIANLIDGLPRFKPPASRISSILWIKELRVFLTVLVQE